MRKLEDDELKAVTSSDDFLDFVERSSKVIERALDEEYDVLADYELGGVDGDLEEDEETGKKRRGIREVCQFWDERWSKKRMISDISFSPKVYSMIQETHSILTNFVSSSLSLCWHPTPKTPLPPMSQTAWCRSGTSTCNHALNMSSTLLPTFSLPNSLLFILISLWEAHIQDRSSYGILAPLALAEVLLSRKHH